MFRKYNSIENSYQTEFVEQIKREGLDAQPFVVQEKAHGANISFWSSDGVQFQAAKRTGELSWDEKFYNFQLVFQKNLSRLQQLWQEVTAQYGPQDIIHIFGELIGGSYKHPDVAKDKQAVPTQKGIWYCPSNEFYAFDIMLNYTHYLPVDEANQLFEKAGFIYAHNLFTGSLNDCLAYPNLFESTIYQQFGLPQIEPNVAEGVVIKSLKSCFLSGGQRVILKNKNERWEEVANAKKSDKPPVPIPDTVRFLQEEIQRYVTENRLNNLISKVGTDGLKDFGVAMSLFSKDIIDDFEKDFGKTYQELDKNDRKLVKKAISRPASILISAVVKRW
jgi:Rnl2 family RNA ligase